MFNCIYGKSKNNISTRIFLFHTLVLERHHGKRKNAANDLKISERTLYRKIKEYGLD